MKTINQMKLVDIDSVVKIHLASFEGFFLSFLGEAFLKELYTGILADPSGICFVIYLKDQIKGFVIGSDNPRGLYKRLLRSQWWNFALASFLPVIRKPKSLIRLIRAVSQGDKENVSEDCSSIMSIAISPDTQEIGLGKLLIKAFLDEAYNRDAKSVNLSTDKNDNESANIFYQKIGFHLNNEYSTAEGREMNEYLIDLPYKITNTNQI